MWNRTIGGNRYDDGWAILRTPYGYALSGNSESFNNNPDLEYWFVLTDSNGRINYNLTAYTVGQGIIMSGNQTYMSGANVNLVAVPADGWTFNGWSGDASGASSTSIIMDNDKTVTAVFIQAGTPTPAPPSATPSPTSSSTIEPTQAPTSQVSPTLSTSPSPSSTPKNATPAPTPIAPELSLIILIPILFLAIIAAIIKRNQTK